MKVIITQKELINLIKNELVHNYDVNEVSIEVKVDELTEYISFTEDGFYIGSFITKRIINENQRDK